MAGKNNLLETFFSLQGEGIKIGTPSVFARFAGCNLNCPWCDTKYSLEEVPTIPLSEFRRIVQATRVNDIVITGGEPLLNQDLVIEIIESFPEKNITIETNGTILPSSILKNMAHNINVLWSVSPKLFLKDWDKNLLEFEKFKDVQFKFVITDLNSDIEKIQFFSSRHPVILQPNGNTDDYSLSCKMLAEKVLFRKLYFRVLPQFHKICWKGARGI
jgi:organic radical activating enzyme